MAQTGYTPILIYSSSTTSNTPAAGSLTNSALGSELAINITDGKLFYKDNANAVQVIAWKITPTTAGGTGLTSYSQGDLLYYNSGTTLTALAKNTSATRYLSNTGTNNNPAWAQIDLSNGVTNVLPAANGGTGVNNSTRTLTISGNSGTLNFTAASKTLSISNSLTFAGTDSTTMTFPSTSATIARTDAAQTFTGTQTFGAIIASSLSVNSNNISADNSINFRNRIINGAMAIDQRNAGASQTITAAAALAYTIDRWYAYCTGANVTGQRVAGSGSNQFRYQFTGAASVTKIGFAQRIESFNSYDLNNITATLSVDLANSVLTTVTWTAWYANTDNSFGTLASPTRTQIATGTFTVTSTVTRYSANINIPAAATTGIEIEFSVGAQTSGTWTIGNVQLEAGNVSTPFERRPYGTELVLCQRYYQQIGKSNNVSYQPYGTGVCTSTTTASIMINLPTMMRSNPTFTFNGATNTFTGTAGTAVTSVASDIMSPTTVMYQVSVASGLTAGNGARHYQNSTNASSLELSAEL